MEIVQQELPGLKRKPFYVYVLCRPDGRPFYVGKGQGGRVDAHEWAAQHGYKGRRFSIIRKIWRQGGQVFKMKVFTTENEWEAYDMEQRIIAAIGREHLSNETDGGDGNFGWQPSIETRARLSAAGRGRKLSPEWYANVQAAKIGKPRSEACKEKIREKLTGRTLPSEHVKNAAAGHRGQKRSEEARRNISEGQRGVPRLNGRGEKHHAAQLTADQVREIRRKHAAGEASHGQLAKLYGVAKPTIKTIVARRTWKWLED